MCIRDSTSFTFLPIARDIVVSEIRAGRSGFEAYGAFLGTCMVAALLEIGLSFIPPKAMRKIFPPVVTGTCVSLIGMGLVATGMKYWGGGVLCAHSTARCALTAHAPRATMGRTAEHATCSRARAPDASRHATRRRAPRASAGSCAENTFSRAAAFGGPQLCTGNGEVMLGYGAPEYFGLGLSVLLMLVALNIFGSPFMKNCGVIIALFFGYIVSAIAWYTDANGKELRYVTAARIESAPWVSFPWVTTFPLGFYPPAFIPILIAFVVTSVETIGDIAASCDASQIPSTGRDAETRIQGGLLCDGFNSLIACLMTTPPNTTFSQNNGVISLTRCASRAAGLACAGWLMLFGVLAKFAGVIASIPECVLGGMTIFLFANVLVSGIAIITGSGALNRRNRFILAISLGVGLGVTAVPEWAEGGGVAAFYGGNLKHNIGLMPAKDACIVFPKRVRARFRKTRRHMHARAGSRQRQRSRQHSRRRDGPPIHANLPRAACHGLARDVQAERRDLPRQQGRVQGDRRRALGGQDAARRGEGLREQQWLLLHRVRHEPQDVAGHGCARAHRARIRAAVAHRTAHPAHAATRPRRSRAPVPAVVIIMKTPVRLARGSAGSPTMPTRPGSPTMPARPPAHAHAHAPHPACLAQYCIGTLIALVLNAIMPHEEMDDYEKSQHGFAPGATISKM